MKRTIIFLIMLSLVFSCGIQTTGVSTLEVSLADILPTHEKKLGDTDLDRLIIFDIQEDDKYYYFLFGCYIGIGDAVMRSDKTDLRITTIYSIYSDFVGYSIGSMRIDEGQTIRFDLLSRMVGVPSRFFVIGDDGHASFIDYGSYSAGHNDTDFAFWCEYENRQITRVNKWDDGKVTTFEMSYSGQILDITSHNGNIYYLVSTGDVYQLSTDEDLYVANILAIQGRYGELYTGDLVSAGGRLWAAGGVMTSNSWSLGNLVNITDGIEYQIRVGAIRRSIENSDGSLCFMTEFVPASPLPRSLPPQTTVIVISNTDEIENETIPGNCANIEQNYIDSLGNTWTYNLRDERKGIIKTDKDGVSINYYFANERDKHEITVAFNEIEIGFEFEPYIINDRVLAPIEGVAYLLGASVNWDDNAQTATITKDNVTIKLAIGQKSASINGKTVELDAAPELRDGIVMVPLRFVSESFSASVDWNNDSRTALIITADLHI